MKNIFARGGVEFLAVFLGIALSLWVDDYRENINIKKDVRNSLNAIALELGENKETLSYIIKNIKFNDKFSDRLLDTKNFDNQKIAIKDSIWNANIIPLGNKLYVNAYKNMVSSGLLYKIYNRKLLHEIQTVYEFDIKNFEWWVDYETKFVEHIDKYIFKNLALSKKAYNWELDWNNFNTVNGLKTTEFQNLIIGNRSNRDALKYYAEKLNESMENILKGIEDYNKSR